MDRGWGWGCNTGRRMQQRKDQAKCLTIAVHYRWAKYSAIRNA